MARDPGKTSLILGLQDIVDLQAAVDAVLLIFRTQLPSTYERNDGYRRYLRMRERLNNAARRIEQQRGGRGTAAS